jgi:hypothetical protein
MNIDVVELASELIAMPSETPTSNRPISDFLRGVLEGGGFAVEELSYIDPFDVEKVSLVAKKGIFCAGCWRRAASRSRKSPISTRPMRRRSA